MVINYLDKYNKLSRHPNHLDAKHKKQLQKLTEWVAVHRWLINLVEAQL